MRSKGIGQFIMIIVGILIGLEVVYAFTKFDFKLKKEEPKEEETAIEPEITFEIPERSDIFGTILINGYYPANDKGIIKIFKRDHYEGQFEEISSIADVADGVEWMWAEAVTNKKYDIKAELHYEDKKIAETKVQTVTAPSSRETLVFNLEKNMFPIVIDPKTKKSVRNKVELGKLEGVITINGYVPSGSVLNVYMQRVNSELPSEKVATVNAKNTNKFTYAKAIIGNTYTIRAELVAKDKSILGVSSGYEYAAPSDNVNISFAASGGPVESAFTGSLKGNVKISGYVPEAAKITILSKKYDESEYKENYSLDAVDYAQWELKDMELGQIYAIRADVSYKGGGFEGIPEYSPATGEGVLLHVNAAGEGQRPENAPSIDVCKESNTGKSYAVINLKDVKDADIYWFEAGSVPGTFEIFDGIITARAGDSDATMTFEVDNNKDYFARYAFTKCLDCKNKSAFSDFSNILKFRCDVVAPQNPEDEQ